MQPLPPIRCTLFRCPSVGTSTRQQPVRKSLWHAAQQTLISIQCTPLQNGSHALLHQWLPCAVSQQKFSELRSNTPRHDCVLHLLSLPLLPGMAKRCASPGADDYLKKLRAAMEGIRDGALLALAGEGHDTLCCCRIALSRAPQYDGLTRLACRLAFAGCFRFPLRRNEATIH